MLLARVAARGELSRARLLLGSSAPRPGMAPRQRTLLGRLVAPIRDGAPWRATAYFVLMLPAGIATFTAAVTWWATGLGLLTLPAWAWALPHDGLQITDTYSWSHPWQLALSSLVGLLLTLAGPSVIHIVTFVDRGLLRLLRR